MSNKKQPKSNDLLKTIQNSTAMQSLSMEQKVANQLRKLKWDAVQSCFYSDIKENKTREIDVLGKQVWTRKTSKDIRDDDVLRLHIVVECKSAKGFHLLFVRTPSDSL